jgi:GT2 family glycosyltransferase
MPLISIVCVSLNNHKYVDLFLESLHNNTRTSFEFLLHGNLATPALEEVVTKWRTKGVQIYAEYSPNENQWYALPANKLFHRAKGMFVAFYDDDTYLAPNWDIELLKNVNADIDAQMLCSTAFQYPESPSQPVHCNIWDFGRTAETFDKKLFDQTCYGLRTVLDYTNEVHGNYFMTRECWRKYGGYDPQFTNGADIDLKTSFFDRAMRLGSTIEFRQCPTALHYHFGNVSRSGDVINMGPSQYYYKWKCTPRENGNQ